MTVEPLPHPLVGENMGNLTTLPTDWKPLVEAAEAEARENFTSFREQYRARNGIPCRAWDELHEELREDYVKAQAALLADLRRPASRDFWTRSLAEKVGLAVETTAPRWGRHVCTDGSAYWFLEGAGFRTYEFRDPAIAKIVDPAAALCAALLAVWSAPVSGKEGSS